MGLAAAARGVACAKDYQRDRILVFLDRCASPRESVQRDPRRRSAIASGQLLGRAWPARHRAGWPFSRSATQISSFAVFAETWGFVVAGVAPCYALLLLRGFDIAASTREPVGGWSLWAVTALVSTQVLVTWNGGGADPRGGDPAAVHEVTAARRWSSHDGLRLLLSVRMRQFHEVCREQTDRRQRRPARNARRVQEVTSSPSSTSSSPARSIVGNVYKGTVTTSARHGRRRSWTSASPRTPFSTRALHQQTSRRAGGAGRRGRRGGRRRRRWTSTRSPARGGPGPSRRC